MRKLLPLLVVSILVFGGLGTVAIPIEKLTEAKPLKAEDSPVEIVIAGGLLGYKVKVTNVGNETLENVSLNMTITTNATFMIFGEELDSSRDFGNIEPDASKIFWMRPALGFGPAAINVSCSLGYGDGPIDEYSGNTTGFVLLIIVRCDIIEVL